jgi:hypothetical protein
MTATGTWNVKLIAPMPTADILFEVVESDGVITGTATAEGETVELIDGVANGSALSWTMNITKPLKMSFRMDITQDGDSWTGKAKAKIFPAAKVVGTRVS